MRMGVRHLSGIFLSKSQEESPVVTPQRQLDQYHRYREDISLMSYVGITAYRLSLSLSWSRVLQHGGSKPDVAEISFYDRLIDELLDVGITP
jgi:beta-glucosidase